MSMAVVLTKLNIYNLVRFLFPVTFLTNSFAIAVLFMIVIRKMVLSLNSKIKVKLWWASLIALSVVPTFIWVLKIPNFNQFPFGTILWAGFVLLTMDRLKQLPIEKSRKLIRTIGPISIIVAVILTIVFNHIGEHLSLLQPGFVAVSHLAMLPSNFFAFGTALYVFDLLTKFKIESKLSFAMLFGATLFNTHFLMIDSFWNNLWKTSLWDHESTGSMLLGCLVILIVMTFFVVLIEHLRQLAETQIIERKPKAAVSFVVSFIVACLSNVTLLLINTLFNVHSVFINGTSRTQLMLLNVLLFLALTIVIYTIINRLMVSTIVSLALLVAFSFGNYQKIISRNEPVMPIDITSNLSNVNEIADLVNIWLVVFLIIVIIAVIVSVVWYERKIKLSKPFNLYQRLGAGIISVAFLMFFMAKLPLVPSSVVTWKAKDHTITNDTLAKQVRYIPHPGDIWWDFKANGPAVAFMSRFSIPVMDKPDGYSASKIAQLNKKYGNLANSINKTRTNNIKNDVVVYILSESFSNPNRVPGVKMDQNPVPYTDQIKQQNTSGIMDSYGYGGGTADIEFEALSGMSLNNFNPALSTPYVELMPKLDYMPTVLDLFNTKNAIHPFQPGLYNRINVFKQLGFSKFYNTKDPNKVTYTDKLNGSGYISDLSAYKELNKVMNENKNGQFIQLSTMQNHMPFKKNEYKNNYPISGPFTGASLDKLKTYTEGIHQSDQSLKYLINKVNQEKRHVTLVYYGDHLPGAYAWAKDNDENMTKYDSQLHQTDYFIYSNYTHKKVQKPVVAPYMFTPMMLQQTDSKVSAYYALLTKCMETLPAGEREKYMESDGKQITEDKLTAKQKQLLKDYKLIQYDITAGKHYLKRGSDFFKVKED
ncbi:phosphatidylglycerol--membrane-oligosaccharide glycerophosphotransferase [Pediococcus argentinicus]|uniref:Phosphatidylglycerol--membrane-oligosaccharide glycerophosphotransferase n=3 Tax=Pediococcus argentinicus TaxID=480391 RepID=A0A0R2NSH9_9LACO|nr:phosphatidylglycerol--membrane-oligosaccharide glycerophosphotransferase [Pediococcus argentinicus]